ncbi:MAG: glutathione S-transferase C-terminal domain-containing protein, partial [Myxococcota bacterium]
GRMIGRPRTVRDPTKETPMELYFAPLTGSLATRIALAEFELDADFIEVDPFSKDLIDQPGRRFTDVHRLGLVPALRLAEGQILSENVAILWHLAEKKGALPPDPLERAHLLEWLSFTATELHRRTFGPFFDPTAGPEVREWAAAKGQSRLEILAQRLGDRTYAVGERFTIADAYLTTALHWARATPLELPSAAATYLKRQLKRPSVAAAIAIEMPLFLIERERETTPAAFRVKRA